jgi:hypothetical protein
MSGGEIAAIQSAISSLSARVARLEQMAGIA